MTSLLRNCDKCVSTSNRFSLVRFLHFSHCKIDASIQQIRVLGETQDSLIARKHRGRGWFHLLVKVSINRFVSSRIERIRNEVEAETQGLRNRTLDELEEIFREATKVIKGEIKHQRINGKMISISLNQRRRWMCVAQHIVLTMNSIACNFDERQIDTLLAELERLVNEARTADQPSREYHAQS